ncbi:DNA-3-methyladenine glycosylase [Trichomonascus vanleenenianus]|uniref:DNA-3-methyladenine glycosylase II n=1 Tax=Trichomonascus vanleenenianus TaxID=2268995 RepID=UPI003EC9FA3A
MAITRSRSAGAAAGSTIKAVVNAVAKKTAAPKASRVAKATVVAAAATAKAATIAQADEAELDPEIEAKALEYRAKLDPRFVEALDYVEQVDPSLGGMIRKSTFTVFEVEQIRASQSQSAYQYLVRSIIGQQVSGAAAKAIATKFIGLFKNGDVGHFPEPQEVLDKPFEELRGAGLSNRKAEYIQLLSKAFAEGQLTEQHLREASDEEITTTLVGLKGIGPWTAEMFLIFYLRRLNTFSLGDLGVQRGFYYYLNSRPWLAKEISSADLPPLKKKKVSTVKKNTKWSVPDERHMTYVSDKFRPYRSAFQLLMWRFASTDTEILEKADLS